jgi:hypothetical protein
MDILKKQDLYINKYAEFRSLFYPYFTRQSLSANLFIGAKIKTSDPTFDIKPISSMEYVPLSFVSNSLEGTFTSSDHYHSITSKEATALGIKNRDVESLTEEFMKRILQVAELEASKYYIEGQKVNYNLIAEILGMDRRPNPYKCITIGNNKRYVNKFLLPGYMTIDLDYDYADISGIFVSSYLGVAYDNIPLHVLNMSYTLPDKLRDLSIYKFFINEERIFSRTSPTVDTIHVIVKEFFNRLKIDYRDIIEIVKVDYNLADDILTPLPLTSMYSIEDVMEFKNDFYIRIKKAINNIIIDNED